MLKEFYFAVLVLVAACRVDSEGVSPFYPDDSDGNQAVGGSDGEDGGNNNADGACGNTSPPSISGGTFTIFSGNESPIDGSTVAAYTCFDSYIMAGNSVIKCVNGQSWEPAPTCQAPPGATRVAGRVGGMDLPSPCTRTNFINTENCDEVIRYRYVESQKTCVGYVACDDSQVGVSQNLFRSRANCKSTCIQVDPIIQSQRNFGGSDSGSCIPGAGSRHSSCLDNGANAIQTIPFRIADALEPHDIWRRFTNPRSSNMQILSWDDRLAITAERRAAQCARSTTSQESNPSDRAVSGMGYIGQNVCISPDRKSTWKECVTRWATQRGQWRYGTGSINGNNNEVKNYVQLVFGATKFIGCGMAQCNNGGDEYFVAICNYGSGNNIDGGPRTAAQFSRPFDT